MLRWWSRSTSFNLKSTWTRGTRVVKMGLSAGVLLMTTSCTTTSIYDTPMQTLKPTKPVIALVLGGGGAKGFAHVGVIKALEARGIKPDLIVGSSVGSFVGSLYASGMTANHLEHLALTTTDNELTDFTLAYQGIIEGVKLKDFVNAQVGQRPIEALPIRFAAVATEKHTGKQAVFTSGNTGLIVQASCSVPNVFIAPRIPEQVGKKYIDGGVSSLVPVDAARALGADVVIAVDITDATSPSKADGQRNIWSMMEQSYVAMQNTSKDGTAKGKYSQGGLPVSQGEVNRADVIIRPKVAHISSVDTSRRSETITAGEKAANEKLAAIAEAIAKAAINPDIK